MKSTKVQTLSTVTVEVNKMLMHRTIPHPYRTCTISVQYQYYTTMYSRLGVH